MKKRFARLLCLLLCLSVFLSSCDKSDGDGLQKNQDSSLGENTVTDTMVPESDTVELIDEKLSRYREATRLLEEGNIEGAYDIFLTLKDFRDVNDHLERFSFEADFEFYKSSRPDYSHVFYFEYDQYGRVAERLLYSSEGSSLNHYRCEYDDKGNVAREEYEYASQNKEVYKYEYDDAGNAVKVTLPEGGYLTAEYDANSNLLRKTKYYAPIFGGGLYTDSKYEYDSKGQLVKDTFVYNDRETVTTYSYDDNGNLIEEIYVSDHSSGYRIVCEYDERGLYIKRMHYTGREEVPNSVWTWEYDDNGNLLKEACEHTDDTFTCHKYEYDTNGYLVESRYYVNEDLLSTVCYENDGYGNVLKETTKHASSPDEEYIRLFYGYKLYYNPFSPIKLPENFIAKG